MLVFLLVLLIMLLPTRIFAATQSVAIVKVENDYSIYIDSLENKDFKFAFTNQNPEDETSFESQLIPNWEDNNGVNIACLEEGTSLNLNEPVFMIVKVGEELSVTELKELAKSKKIKGYSKMNKEELKKALSEED